MTAQTSLHPVRSDAGDPIPQAEIVVVGSLNLDLMVRTPRHPRAGETLKGHALTTAAGGKGANQAVAAARLGAATAMIGCVGDDDHGRTLLAGLEREGIRHQGVMLSRTRPSGVAIIQIDDASENRIVVIPGSNAELAPADILRSDALLRCARLLVCQLEVPVETVHHALAVARTHGCPTLLNAAPAMTLPRELLTMVDWLVVNESEAEALARQPVTSPVQAEQAITQLHALGCRRVLVTLGSQGVVAGLDTGIHHYPAQPVIPLDSTGAGDTFVGGFAAALVRGDDVESAIHQGQAAAGIAVTRAGAQDAIPWRHELAIN